jgi:CheY-like chemotaxis protein
MMHADRPLVLVVDDDSDCRELVTELLDRNGYAARGVGSGREALRAIDAGFEPDAVVLDLMMPEMNGWDLLDAMRRRPALAHTPVVVISAACDAQRAPIEANRVLSKPFRLQTLLTALARSMGAHEVRTTSDVPLG